MNEIRGLWQFVKDELYTIRENLKLLEEIKDRVGNYTLDDLYEEIERIGVALVKLTSYYADREHYKRKYAMKDTRRKGIFLKDENFMERQVDLYDRMYSEMLPNDESNPAPAIYSVYDQLGLLYFVLNEELNYLLVAKIEGFLTCDLVYKSICTIVDQTVFIEIQLDNTEIFGDFYF